MVMDYSIYIIRFFYCIALNSLRRFWTFHIVNFHVRFPKHNGSDSFPLRHYRGPMESYPSPRNINILKKIGDGYKQTEVQGP